MIDPQSLATRITRRSFFAHSLAGLGTIALHQLLARDARAGSERWLGAVNPPHFPVRAKRVIHLCMAGGASQHETFDFKPELKRLHGQPFPESFTQGQQLAQLQNTPLKARGASVAFKRWGESGQEISEWFPHIGGIADSICIVRSMQTEQINHDPAHAFMNTGSAVKGRPSMGSWLLYGLGAETDELPGFVVLVSQGAGGAQPVSARQWSAGFLPSKFQGIPFQSRGDAVHYIKSPDGITTETQRATVNEIGELNGWLAEQRGDPEIETRIAQYEMAFRMQTSVPKLTDLRDEPQSTLDRYGVKKPGDGSFASNCLLARRLAERGVRFIQLYHRGWDHHDDIDHAMPRAASETDQASAALVQDLQQRGLLDDTLVIWGGEFGRTPMSQGSGRDHHILGFSIWLAGAGIKGGSSYGATDELGYRAVVNPVHVHDLHATMLYLCGIDHKRLTYRYQGRDFRLTDVTGNVVKDVLTV